MSESKTTRDLRVLFTRFVARDEGEPAFLEANDFRPLIQLSRRLDITTDILAALAAMVLSDPQPISATEAAVLRARLEELRNE